jgi:hypothetical protein
MVFTPFHTVASTLLPLANGRFLSGLLHQDILHLSSIMQKESWLIILILDAE